MREQKPSTTMTNPEGIDQPSLVPMDHASNRVVLLTTRGMEWICQLVQSKMSVCQNGFMISGGDLARELESE